MRSPRRRATFIHEMTHVWQGCNNGHWSGTYQAKSVVAQVREGVRDIIRTKDYDDGIKNWDRHRSTAYRLDVRWFGRPWSSFNVEQQATIVETWFIDEALRRSRGNDGPGVFGASMSPYDARFPYIRDVIRKRSPTASYFPVVLPAGADPTVKALQDTLVALGYLDPIHADGLLGRTNSPTLDAVQTFQSRNGLKADRMLGGPNSDTRKALSRPVGQLRGAR
ncbi:peptidoglycan-binding domain-containing protein [uncultured Sphingomonas sp.]|uniref:peptidoglycan-binding domain-containing protein n=1 Tax=uncultured Sphingomonas sp. TaxID=158754 RepID=UPI0025F97A2E|nr:peptidoglycan-binding domain-containing protein [uncultured Sphingomonas sp.]